MEVNEKVLDEVDSLKNKLKEKDDEIEKEKIKNENLHSKVD